jgi:membrane glycosyltransferase
MPRRRRASQVLREQLAAPRLSQGWFTRAIGWLFRSEASSALSLGVVFALGLAVSYVIPVRISSAREVVVVTFTLLVFGVFLGVIMVTEENKNYKGSGLRTRVVCGAIAGAAIAVLASAPVEAVALGAMVGAILGFFGMSWAKYL